MERKVSKHQLIPNTCTMAPVFSQKTSGSLRTGQGGRWELRHHEAVSLLRTCHQSEDPSVCSRRERAPGIPFTANQASRASGPRQGKSGAHLVSHLHPRRARWWIQLCQSTAEHGSRAMWHNNDDSPSPPQGHRHTAAASTRGQNLMGPISKVALPHSRSTSTTSSTSCRHRSSLASGAVLRWNNLFSKGMNKNWPGFIGKPGYKLTNAVKCQTQRTALSNDTKSSRRTLTCPKLPTC